MRVNASAVELALFRILAAGGTAHGATFGYDELRAAWSATGLRVSDLHHVLHRLTGDGCLRRCAGSTLRYRLTPGGRDRLFNPLAPMDALPTHATDTRALAAMSRRGAPS
ncbi:MAG TPA: hypothetical protein VM369_02595 [Candidatus Binatia bacterium]|nr:hypothetical protein [Candidatus Binatia bacterium]